MIPRSAQSESLKRYWQTVDRTTRGKASGAKPVVWTPDMEAAARTALLKGKSQKVTAHMIGVAPGTLRKWMNRR